MISEVSISERAEADLMSCHRWYVDQAGADIGARFLVAFDRTISYLMTQPESGRRRKFSSPELSGIRSFPVGDAFGVYLIFYRFTEVALSIERVMNGARDLPRRIGEPLG